MALVFALQLGLIFWLSDSELPQPRPGSPAPAIRLASGASVERLALPDPVVFALPHPHGFSGLSWLKVPALTVPSFEQIDPPRFLPLPAPALAEVCRRFVQTNDFEPLAAAAAAGPAEPTLPEIGPLVPARDRSVWHFEGDLARRRLLTRLELPSWQHADLLTNSIVQMVVDGAGAPVSLTLLPPGSGLAEADKTALAIARTARFEPLPASGGQALAAPLARLTWGRMVFDWHTLPIAPTNAAAGP